MKETRPSPESSPAVSATEALRHHDPVDLPDESAVVAARLEAESFRLMSEYNVDVLCRMTLDIRCVYCSPSAEIMLGWSAKEMLASFPHELIHPEDLPLVKAAHARRLEKENFRHAPVTLRVRTRDAGYLWVEVNARLMLDPLTQTPWQVLLSIRDISERKKLEKKLEALTLTDFLTGIGNRRAFDQALEAEWRRAQRNKTALSLLLLDVDYFKAFNDQYGHQVGDDCLRIIATAVAQVARRPGELASRYGGEEMAIILPTTDAEGAIRIAKQLKNAINAMRVPHAGNPQHGSHVTVSIGAATVLARDGGTPSLPAALVQAADAALYKAKQRGRDRYETALLLRELE